jgi:predicted permease
MHWHPQGCANIQRITASHQGRITKLFEILTQNILPVFSIMVLGFAMGSAHFVSKSEATTVNRIAFMVLQPALIFPLVNGVDLSGFHTDAILLYAAAQAIVFCLTLAVCLYVMRCTFLEAWLLAMATVFVNSLLYIWPISSLIYGTEGNFPITALVVWDSTITFAFFIITTDLFANKEQSLRSSALRLLKNPVLIAIFLGITTNLLGLSASKPLLVAFQFAGAAAAPLTLFALGVILSGHSLIPNSKVTLVSAIKLMVLPVAVLITLSIGERPIVWDEMVLLNAAGPSGAMAFALATLYKVRTDTIAPVIIWTSVLSLFSLAWLA